MPFDGCESDWRPRPERPRYSWYFIEPVGQRRKRKRWQVRAVHRLGDEFEPLFSFYADTKRQANGTAAWFMQRINT